MFGSQEVCWEEEEREAMEPISDLPVRRLLDLPSHNLVVGWKSSIWPCFDTIHFIKKMIENDLIYLMV